MNYLKEKHFEKLENILCIFQGFSPDFIGVKNNCIILVEAKSNNLDDGKDEARAGFGQILHYHYYMKKEKSL
jgi:hypothetical protein